MTPRRRDFESIMLSTRATLSLTNRRLNDGEFRALIGMLCLAGDSQERGLLLVGGTPATHDEIADFAKCKPSAVASAIEKLLAMETLERHDDGTLGFLNWARFQPAPRPSDQPDATRERKARQRDKARGHADVTRDTSPPVTTQSRDPFAGAIGRREVEGKGSTPPSPPRGGRQRDRDLFETEMLAWCTEHFPGVDPGLVRAGIGALGRPGQPPTVEALAAYLERWTGAAA